MSSGSTELAAVERSPNGMITTRVAIDVSDLVPFAGSFTLEGWVRTPPKLERSTRPIALFCLPGGKCTTAYFDLGVEGYADYSMADYLAARGFIVVAFDHLGVGASSRVEDVFAVTPGLAGAVNDRAHRATAERLTSGSLVPGLGPLPGLAYVGVGHSMGGMLLTVQQARHPLFEGVAVLGHGGDGLDRYLTEDERSVLRERRASEEVVAELARARFSGAQPRAQARPLPGAFLPADLPDAVRDAFVAQQSDLIFCCGLTSMIPGATDGEKAAITVPVFLAFGEHDLTHDFAGSVARYASSHDVTLYVVPDAAHCHNQATARTALWDRLAYWARGL